MRLEPIKIEYIAGKWLFITQKQNFITKLITYFLFPHCQVMLDYDQEEGGRYVSCVHTSAQEQEAYCAILVDLLGTYELCQFKDCHCYAGLYLLRVMLPPQIIHINFHRTKCYTFFSSQHFIYLIVISKHRCGDQKPTTV